MADNRRNLDIPDDIEDWVMETFRDAAKSDSEAFRMALWYAKDRYEAEHGKHEGDG